MSTAQERKWYAAVHSLEFCVLCNGNDVECAHSNQDRGLGQKSAPWLTALLCRTCHYGPDNGHKMNQAERRATVDRAIVLTHDALIRSGRLVLR